MHFSHSISKSPTPNYSFHTQIALNPTFHTQIALNPTFHTQIALNPTYHTQNAAKLECCFKLFFQKFIILWYKNGIHSKLFIEVGSPA